MNVVYCLRAKIQVCGIIQRVHSLPVMSVGHTLRLFLRHSSLSMWVNIPEVWTSLWEQSILQGLP